MTTGHPHKPSTLLRDMSSPHSSHPSPTLLCPVPAWPPGPLDPRNSLKCGWAGIGIKLYPNKQHPGHKPHPVAVGSALQGRAMSRTMGCAPRVELAGRLRAAGDARCPNGDKPSRETQFPVQHRQLTLGWEGQGEGWQQGSGAAFPWEQTRQRGKHQLGTALAATWQHLASRSSAPEPPTCG